MEKCWEKCGYVNNRPLSHGPRFSVFLKYIAQDLIKPAIMKLKALAAVVN